MGRIVSIVSYHPKFFDMAKQYFACLDWVKSGYASLDQENFPQNTQFFKVLSSQVKKNLSSQIDDLSMHEPSYEVGLPSPHHPKPSRSIVRDLCQRQSQAWLCVQKSWPDQLSNVKNEIHLIETSNTNTFANIIL